MALIPTKTDEDLARAVQAGHADAFGELVLRYEEKMERYARRFLLSSEEADDVIQDVFLKAYEHIQQFDASRRFSPWFYRIAHNELIDFITARKREPTAFFDPDTLFPHPIAKETAEGPAEKAEMARFVEACLGKLDVKYREPLTLYYMEDMSYEEIADVLRIPVSTVGVRLRRARERVKNIAATEPYLS